MALREEPKLAHAAPDPDLDATDGGWDPYVTGLLTGELHRTDADDQGAEDAAPVMSFSRSRSSRTPPA